MRKKQLLCLVSLTLLAPVIWAIMARAGEPAPVRSANDSRLAVVWTSGDPDVAHRVCFMYTDNAAKNKWFGEVRLVIWGPSARLLAGDKDLQAKIKTMMADGVKVQACIACATSYGVVDVLRGLGIEVKAMGQPLTEILKSDYKVLTF